MKGKTCTKLTPYCVRAYAGVRPLVAMMMILQGEMLVGGIALLDHAERDGLDGFITITGGKLMTYRLMAEWATDLVCKTLLKKLNALLLNRHYLVQI